MPIVNSHPNIRGREYDQLKSILHHAARHGPASTSHGRATNLRAHLEGRIAWVASLNPERGIKLRRRFDQINWEL